MYHRIFNFNKIIWKLGPYLSNFIIVARALASHGCKSSEFEIPYYYGLIFFFLFEFLCMSNIYQNSTCKSSYIKKLSYAAIIYD